MLVTFTCQLLFSLMSVDVSTACFVHSSTKLANVCECCPEIPNTDGNFAENNSSTDYSVIMNFNSLYNSFHAALFVLHAVNAM